MQKFVLWLFLDKFARFMDKLLIEILILDIYLMEELQQVFS